MLIYIYDENGSPIGVKHRNKVFVAEQIETYLFGKNLQGDIIEIYNTSGTAIVKYVYDAWGNIISTSGTQATGIGAKNSLRYRGYYYDIETGLYYLQARYYDPVTGRFINADSCLYNSLQGFNLYAYCYNDPVMFADYTGENAAAAWETWNAYGQDIAMADGPLPFGDSIYFVGMIVIGFGVLVEWVCGDTSKGAPQAPSAEDKAPPEQTEEVDAPQNITDEKIPNVKYPGNDSTKAPSDDYVWKGKNPVGGDKGAWVNNKTGEQFHPDLNHKPPKGPHWDYKDIFGYWWDLYEYGIDPNSWR